MRPFAAHSQPLQPELIELQLAPQHQRQPARAPLSRPAQTQFRQHVPLHHAPAGDPLVLDNAPVAMLLAILPANCLAGYSCAWVGGMKQLTLAMAGFERYAKTTRRAVFLAEMERVVPWSALCALIEPFYPKPGN